MKLGDLQQNISYGQRVHVRFDSDQVYILSNLSQIQQYMLHYGDIPVQWDKANQFWDTPTLEKVRNERINAKAAHCSKFGSD